MIIHIALYHWKQRTGEKEIAKNLEQIKLLKNKVPGIKKIYCGKNYHKESKRLTHGIVIIAKNQKALDEYRQHPDHKTIAKKIESIEDDGLGFDFED